MANVQPRRRSHRAHSTNEIKTATKLIDKKVQTLWKYKTIYTTRDGTGACYISPERLQLIRDVTLEEFKTRDINLKGINDCFNEYFDIHADEQEASDNENGIY